MYEFEYIDVCVGVVYIHSALTFTTYICFILFVTLGYKCTYKCIYLNALSEEQSEYEKSLLNI
jgi:hypothetical protein